MRQFDSSPKIYNRSFKNYLEEQKVSIKSGYFERQSQQYSRYFYFCPPDAKKHALLFIHATGNDALFPNLSYLAFFIRHGWQVFSFDLDGHGRDSTTSLDQDEIWTVVESALGVFRNHILPDSKIHLWGESIGGLLAWFTACQAQPLASSAICVAAPFHLNLNSRAMLNELRSVNGQAFHEYRKRWGLIETIPAVGPFLRSRYPIRQAKAARSVFQNFSYPKLIASMLKSEHLRAAKEPKIPVFALFGDLDLLAPATARPAYFETHANQCYIFHGCTHFDMLLGESNMHLVRRLIVSLEAESATSP